MYKQKESYNSKTHYFLGDKLFWPVQKNQPIIDARNKLNVRNKELSKTTYDFSNLYKNVPEIN